MAFVQLVEFTSQNTDQIRALTDRYQKETEGKRTTVRVLVCADREIPDRYVVVAEFGSYEEAMANSELPETREYAEAMAKLVDGPLSYRNLEVIEALTGEPVRTPVRERAGRRSPSRRA